MRKEKKYPTLVSSVFCRTCSVKRKKCVVVIYALCRLSMLSFAFDIQSVCGVQGKQIHTSTLLLSSYRVLDSSLDSL